MPIVKTVSTACLAHAKRVKITTAQYCNSKSLYVGLYTTKNELYMDITTNIFPLPAHYGFVETNSEAEKFIKEQKIATPTKETVKQGFNTYRLWIFNI